MSLIYPCVPNTFLLYACYDNSYITLIGCSLDCAASCCLYDVPLALVLPFALSNSPHIMGSWLDMPCVSCPTARSSRIADAQDRLSLLACAYYNNLCLLIQGIQDSSMAEVAYKAFIILLLSIGIR